MRRVLPLLLLLAVSAPAEAAGSGADAAPARREGMVRLPAGSTSRLFAMAGDTVTRQAVGAFWLDRDPVTRAQFLQFVRRHPQWRRSNTPGVYAAGGTYLRDWRGDLDLGDAAAALPVTWVSWHAARAYCEAQGARLPTLAEWEYAAAADATQRDASRDPQFIQQLTALYARRGHGVEPSSRLRANAWGVRGLHEFGWEWVEDFNATIASDDSRGFGGRDVDAVCASAAIGATDTRNYPAFLRSALRAGLEGNSGMASLGFRCAAS
ncbi:MAG TPA: formylglycine-generating enzyme family protein [Gemmatimonadaceae bacterium]|nr:formylglycine-generating enzyme family protein [Gemmatimonadaceae bacterium]